MEDVKDKEGYILNVNYGRPYTTKYKTQDDLIRELKRLQSLDVPFLELEILQNEKNITDEIFKQMRMVK